MNILEGTRSSLNPIASRPSRIREEVAALAREVDQVTVRLPSFTCTRNQRVITPQLCDQDGEECATPYSCLSE